MKNIYLTKINVFSNWNEIMWGEKLKEKGIGNLAIVAILVIIVVAIVGGYYATQSSQNSDSNGNDQKRTIDIIGSTTVLPISQSAAEEWMNEHPNDTINVSGGGSGDGIQAIIDGDADIGNASRPIKDEEIQTAEDKGRNIVEHKIAADALSVVVHPNNNVSDLTIEQVRDIFAGEIKNWKDVGGADLEIVVYHREEGSGTRSTFEKSVMEDKQVTSEALTKESNGSMRQAISDNPNGIGYVGLGYLDDSIKALGLGGIEPSEETASSGEYPISRFLYMYTNGEPVGLTGDFIDFVFSEDGQGIVEAQGFIKIAK